MTQFKKGDKVEVDGFKVGDKVKVVYGGAGISAKDIGKITTVIAVHPEAGYYAKLVVDGEGFDYSSYTNKRAIVCATKSVEKVVDAVDFTRPVETRDGKPVTIVTTTGRGDYSVLAYIGNKTSPDIFTSEGKYYAAGAKSNFDLRNVEPKPVTDVVYANVYKNEDGTLRAGTSFPTPEKAEAGRCQTHVGMVKITLVEGEYVSEEA